MLIISRGDKAVRTLPGAEKAALEVCTELASYRKFQLQGRLAGYVLKTRFLS